MLQLYGMQNVNVWQLICYSLPSRRRRCFLKSEDESGHKKREDFEVTDGWFFFLEVLVVYDIYLPI